MVFRPDDEAVRRAVSVLNEALTQDRLAIQRLVQHTEVCKPTLRDNDTIQVREDEFGGSRVGALGLINGILGALPNGRGPVIAVFDKHGSLVEFIRNV
jgi:hypothetical protein